MTYEKRIDEEPTFLRIDNGWYIFDDNGETVMIPPSMSQMIREVTVVEYHSLSQEWADRCRNINPVLLPPPIENPTVYRLDSVGTVITAEGVTYPIVHWSWMGDSGGHGTKSFDIVENGVRKAIWYDADAAIHLADIEPDGDWFDSLSHADKRVVVGIASSMSLDQFRFVARLPFGFPPLAETTPNS